ncbi:hypothetical protein BDV95DRAFT_601521 [Massariosphaeria phaeospora]|uniref:Uncharacterized protein n=1 Tax=Massariosphaeria phaeospora TaxID=100035 RepID=A0A7C8IPB1_9PLEO|nr:hypothetical protein BDV95DRAFT_601521 [Massariosphaeria phaeospora]
MPPIYSLTPPYNRAASPSTIIPPAILILPGPSDLGPIIQQAIHSLNNLTTSSLHTFTLLPRTRTHHTTRMQSTPPFLASLSRLSARPLALTDSFARLETRIAFRDVVRERETQVRVVDSLLDELVEALDALSAMCGEARKAASALQHCVGVARAGGVPAEKDHGGVVGFCVGLGGEGGSGEEVRFQYGGGRTVFGGVSLVRLQSLIQELDRRISIARGHVVGGLVEVMDAKKQWTKFNADVVKAVGKLELKVNGVVLEGDNEREDDGEEGEGSDEETRAKEVRDALDYFR